MSGSDANMGFQSDSADHPRILVVEAEEVIAIDLRRTLTGLGYLVTGVAMDSEEAIRQAAKSRPDVILLDIRLAGAVDGIAAAMEIRRRFGIPVVFLTASNSDEQLQRAQEAFPYGYVLKPFRAKDLNATLLLALQQHRIARELFSGKTWLQSVLSSLSDGIIAVDEAGRIRFLNPAAEALTGWSRAEATGRELDEIYSVVPIDSSDSPAANRYFLRRRNLPAIPIEACSTPLIERGLPSGDVIVFVDISERLRLEQKQTEERERLEQRVLSAAEALDATKSELRALSARLMNVQEQERRGIARDLHDDLGQRMAGLEFNLASIEAQTREAPPQLRADLRESSRQAADIADGLRRVAHGLHSSVISDLGIESALRTLVDEHRKGGEHVAIRLRRVPTRVSLEASVALYRIAQEALRNAAKHAPGSAVQVDLSGNHDELKLTIGDSGPGFDLFEVRLKGGLGLVSIQERAKLAGGSFFLRTAPGAGTSIEIRVPLPALQ